MEDSDNETNGPPDVDNFVKFFENTLPDADMREFFMHVIASCIERPEPEFEITPILAEARDTSRIPRDLIDETLGKYAK